VISRRAILGTLSAAGTSAAFGTRAAAQKESDRGDRSFVADGTERIQQLFE